MEEKQQWTEGQTLDISRFTIPLRDEFAIDFASWFICYYTEQAFYDKDYIKEMLEKYKKERGL